MRPGVRDLLWMATGAILLLLLALLVVDFEKVPDRSAQLALALAAKRLELLNQMRFGLAAASEAEKSAVLALTDEDSRTFADQARAADATVERARADLAALLHTGGDQHEVALLEQFSQAFAELRQLDDDLLGLAVKNSNLKAAGLTYGPAAVALREMSDALDRLVTASAASPDSGRVATLALSAEVGVLRIYALLAPHVAEESDQKMDEMEAAMAREDQFVWRDLDGLAALPTSASSADFATAAARYARFGELEQQILSLSRENTNVRSTTLSLSRKRNLMLLCQDALTALQEAIAAAHARPARSAPVNPR